MKTNTLRIPTEILESANLQNCDEIDISATDNLIIITKSNKTTRELLNSMQALIDVNSEHIVNLALACGICSDCLSCIDDEVDTDTFDCVPEIVLNAFLDANVCLGNLYSLIQSEEIIDEKC
ncbi:MAG: hypothetical protein R3Y09_07730 [Clostridia bacterium]